MRLFMKHLDMKNSILVVIIVLSFMSVQSQNTNLEYKYAVKAYNLTSYYENIRSGLTNQDSTGITTITTDNLKILHPTLAFQWRNEKSNFHELELTSFQVGKLSTQTVLSGGTGISSLTAGSNVITTDIAFRYEYIMNFRKSGTHKLVPSVGVGGNPYYRLYKFQPRVSSEFPASQQDVGLGIFVAPRLTYYLSSRIFFDINIPVCLFDFNYLVNKQDNPELEISERTTTEINIDMFPRIFSGRIGVGMKL
jgi:hypothetical protein